MLVLTIGPFCFTSTEARWLIRDGDSGVGGEVTKERWFDRGYRPKKTGETVDRRQNNGSVKAVSPRHCPATCALRSCCFSYCAWAESQRQCVDEQLEAKEVQLSQPSSTSLFMISSGLT